MIVQPRPGSNESTNNRKQSYFLLLCILMLALATGSPCAQAQQVSAAQAARLSKVEFTGLSRYSQEEAIAASGLQIGQTVDVATIDAASNRLLGSGLFVSLSYRYRTTGDQAVITFTVEEAKGAALPVVFDNFVWFSDEELLNAVRKEMPSFDGKAPDLNAAIDSITRALERLLRERKIPGQVEYTPGNDMSGKNPEHIFSVKGLNIPVCTLVFPGAGNVKESELVKNSKPLLNNPYSRKFVTEFANANLIPIYRQRGYLRASFQLPLPKLEAGNCKDGVVVTMPVEEGLAYSWEKAEWEGNQALPVEVLESSLGMKQGELADGVKIDSGLDTVRGAYGKKGFIVARLILAPSFDDAGRRVTYRIKVNEGAQFRMGNLIITGLSEGDARRLKEKWKLQPGDVYDASYLNEFLKKVVREDRSAGSGKKMETSSMLDRQQLTVDVSIGFK